MINLGYRKDFLSGSLPGWLDHFRWISALLVAMNHLRNLLFPDSGGQAVWEIPFYFITLFGTQAVVVFFVLSGLLVGGLILRDLEHGRFRVSRYAIDRASRLYVALAPALLLSIVLQHYAGGPACAASDRSGAILANMVFLQNFSYQPLCNNHPLWSLSSEAYFYLVAPMLFLAWRRRTVASIVLACAALLPALVFFKPSYMDPLFGLALWLCGLIPWFVRIRMPAWAAALPLLAVLLASRLHLFPDTAVENAAIAFTFVLLLCSDLQDVPAPFIGFGTWFAGFSYSLYLIHMPIGQAIAAKIGFQALPNGSLVSYLIYIVCLAGVLFVAWMFGTLFEARTKRLRKLLARWLSGDTNAVKGE